MFRITIACATILLVFSGGTTRAADCPPLPPPYDGPIFDANVQSWNPNIGGVIDAMQAAGVKRIALFANSREGGGTPTAKAVAALAQANPGAIVLGAPKIGFITEGDLPRGYIAETVNGVKDGTYKFIGEILYTHGDKPDHKPTKTGDIFVNPQGAGTKALLTQVASSNVPLMTHFEAWAWDRDRANFDKLYAAWPQQRFVLPSLAYGSPEKAAAILSAHPNLWGIISRLVDGRYEFVDPGKAAKLGPSMFDECGVLRPDWRAVLIAHSDRLMYGSDFYTTLGSNWSGYPLVIRSYRRIAAQLPADVAARISWDNAAALYGSP
jgi:Amidohydrolase